MRRKNHLGSSELEILNDVLTDEKAEGEFYQDCYLKNLRAATISYYEDKIYIAKKILKFLDMDKQLIELTEKDMKMIIMYWKKTYKATTINANIRGLKRYFNFLHENKMIKNNPMQNIKQLRTDREIIKTLEDNEIILISNHLKHKKKFTAVRDRLIILLLIETGVRISELEEVKVTDFKRNKLIVRHTKNGKQRIVYISKFLQDEVRKYIKLRNKLGHDYLLINIDDNKLSKRGIQRRIQLVSEEVGIKMSAHLLRHTFAKRVVLAGINVFSLAELLGHSDLTITKRYVNLFAEDTEREAMRLNSLGKLKL